MTARDTRNYDASGRVFCLVPRALWVYYTQSSTKRIARGTLSRKANKKTHTLRVSERAIFAQRRRRRWWSIGLDMPTSVMLVTMLIFWRSRSYRRWKFASKCGSQNDD